jgi:hypothetical protein
VKADVPVPGSSTATKGLEERADIELREEDLDKGRGIDKGELTAEDIHKCQWNKKCLY